MTSLEDEASLLASLDLYRSQLETVEACLLSDTNGQNLNDLIQLQSDLKEIVLLTEQTIASHRGRLEENLNSRKRASSATSTDEDADGRSSSESRCNSIHDESIQKTPCHDKSDSTKSGRDNSSKQCSSRDTSSHDQSSKDACSSSSSLPSMSGEDRLDTEYAAFQSLLGEHLSHETENQTAPSGPAKGKGTARKTYGHVKGKGTARKTYGHHREDVASYIRVDSDDDSVGDRGDPIRIDNEDEISIDSGDKISIDSDEEEIRIDDGEDASDQISISDDDSEDDSDAGEDLSGQKCRAPYSHSWGESGYHNAIVLSQEKSSDSKKSLVRVVFCNPTHCSMRPCPYFMRGRCRYGDARCRFSHGQLVKASRLRPFQEPDYRNVVLGSSCLARDDDDLWYAATVVEILPEHRFQVQFNANHELKTVDVQDIFPTDVESELGESSNPIVIDYDGGTGTAASSATAGASSFLSPTSLTIQTTDAPGQWEMHTKGIGSKLMEKMGYIAGQGLGKNSDGRAEPVPINVLPKGMSLDKIMQMKDSAKNDDLFNPHKKQKRKNKLWNSKRKDKDVTDVPPSASSSVFDFINKKLHQRKGNLIGSQATQGTRIISTIDLKSKSDKLLNIQFLKTSEEIKKTQTKIQQLNDTIERANQRGECAVSAEAFRKLSSLRTYLSQLETSQMLIKSQKQTRKTDSLLTKF